MALIKLDPITRRRFARFRKIKRGYYSLLILLGRDCAVDLRALFGGEPRASGRLSGEGVLSHFPIFEHGDVRSDTPAGLGSG